MVQRFPKIAWLLALLLVSGLVAPIAALAQSTPEPASPVAGDTFEIIGNVLNPGAWSVAD